MPPVITSRDNAKIKYTCKLVQSAAFRQTEQSFPAEGLKLCTELALRCPARMVFCTETFAEKHPEALKLAPESYLVQPHVAEKLAETRTPQGVFCVFGWPQWEAEAWHTGGRYLALEGVQDPGNVGTLLRSAAAFGFDAVLLDRGCAHPLAPKTLRAGMGAAAAVPWQVVPQMADALTALREKGVVCYAAALYNSRPLGEALPSPEGGVCVVVGSEGQGLRADTVAACDASLRIPMTSRVESLNAGVAGSVLLWYFRGEGT